MLMKFYLGHGGVRNSLGCIFEFYPRDAILASVLAVVVCLCVCVCVCVCYCHTPVVYQNG